MVKCHAEMQLNPFLPKHGSNVSLFLKQQILDASKLKEFADDNFKFNENASKISIMVENIVGKGEIAQNEQFLLFPQCLI